MLKILVFDGYLRSVFVVGYQLPQLGDIPFMSAWWPLVTSLCAARDQ